MNGPSTEIPNGLGRTLVKKLWLPFDSVRTVYNGTSEVRLYRNDITNVLQIGKRVSAIGADDRAAVFLEPTLLQSIRHDHIVPVHDVAVVEGFDPMMTVIEMIIPYYERGSVFDALRAGERFSVGDAVRLTRGGLLGLAELHDKHRLLHRDIKSANVFIDAQDRLRIGDLGHATPMEADGSASALQDVAQMYSAPETLATGRVRETTDIYGFGLILLELLAGAFPYADYTREAIWLRLKAGKRPLLDSHLTIPPCVSPRLRTVITKAISKKPDARYATARDMIDALDRAPYIDWKPSVDGDESRTWDGVAAGDQTPLRIVASKRARGGWTLSATRNLTRWQRWGIEDQVVPDLIGSGTREFFDQVCKHACRR